MAFDKPAAKKPKIPTKVVIRRLPPRLTEQEFNEIVADLPQTDYFRFVPGDRLDIFLILLYKL